MINYTECITTLMRDLTVRVPRLADVNLDEVLVFARYGRSGADGAYATCHCLNLPPTDPGYYYWCDRQTGQMTRRSEWFVTKSPNVSVNGRSIHYLISFALPRFCDQTLDRSRKCRFYPGEPAWIAKLDTVVHELYHVDPGRAGIRRSDRDDGAPAATAHGALFFRRVAEMVHEYLGTRPDPRVYDFLRYGFKALIERFGDVTATTFRTFPSFPQRYIETLDLPPAGPSCGTIQPLKRSHVPTAYTERDLETRQFFAADMSPPAPTGRMRRTPGRPNRTSLLASASSGEVAGPAARA
jgi:hypothetical protein